MAKATGASIASWLHLQTLRFLCAMTKGPAEPDIPEPEEPHPAAKAGLVFKLREKVIATPGGAVWLRAELARRHAPTIRALTIADLQALLG